MKHLLPFFLIITITGCFTKRQQNIFIIPVNKLNNSSFINPETIRNPILFSDEFWNYFTKQFPSATIGLFYRPSDIEKDFQLTDTSYNWNLISFNNRLSIINRLPKDLSEKESNSYFKGGGFFVIPNDTNQVNLSNSQKPNDEEIKWRKASKQTEQEYLQFYELLKNIDNDYLIIAKTKLLDNFLPTRK